MTFIDPVPVVFGLAFDVEKAPGRKSGFQPAQFDLGAGKNMFGDIRLEGFAALLRTGFAAKLIVVGGLEGRYSSEHIPRAWAICEMLEKDFGIPRDQLSFLVSRSNTGGNVEMIRNEVAGRSNPVTISSHYHLARAAFDFAEKNLPSTLLAAESFVLIENRDLKEVLVERFGGGPLAERILEEVQGMADKLLGTYKPRTDIKVPLPWWRKVFA